jgi:hypothetical protein
MATAAIVVAATAAVAAQKRPCHRRRVVERLRGRSLRRVLVPLRAVDECLQPPPSLLRPRLLERRPPGTGRRTLEAPRLVARRPRLVHCSAGRGSGGGGFRSLERRWLGLRLAVRFVQLLQLL